MVLCVANDTLRKQVALKDQRRVLVLLLAAGVLALHVSAVLWVTSKQQLWRHLGLMPPLVVPSVWDAFYAVAVVDTLIRYGAMVVKVRLLHTARHCRPMSDK